MATFYTVTVRHTDGEEFVSRFFNTRRAAQKWARWCLTHSYTEQVSIYRGQAGGELIERKAA